MACVSSASVQSLPWRWSMPTGCHMTRAFLSLNSSLQCAMIPVTNLAHRLLLASPPPHKHKIKAKLIKYAFNVVCPEPVGLKHFKLFLKATSTMLIIILAPYSTWDLYSTVVAELQWIATVKFFGEKFLFSLFFVHLRLPFSGVEQESFEACGLILRELQSLGRLRVTKA